MKLRKLPRVDNCNDCGACCTGQAALPIHLVGRQDLRTPGVNPLPPDLKAELQALVIEYLTTEFPPDDSPCIWYDAQTKRCRHYDYRPTLCRDEVKPGDAACLRWRLDCGIDPVRHFAYRGGKLVDVGKGTG